VTKNNLFGFKYLLTETSCWAELRQNQVQFGFSSENRYLFPKQSRTSVNVGLINLWTKLPLA